MILSGYKAISWVIRETLTECASYDCALSMLSTTPVIAPGYLILAGTKGNEGAIITRDRYSVAHTETLTDDKWYVLQTNEDHFAG